MTPQKTPAQSQSKRPYKPSSHGVLLKGTPDFITWMNELADQLGVNAPSLIDMALKEFADKRGFRPMPRRRVR